MACLLGSASTWSVASVVTSLVCLFSYIAVEAYMLTCSGFESRVATRGVSLRRSACRLKWKTDGEASRGGTNVPVGDPQRLLTAGLRHAAQAARAHRRHHLRPSEGRAGRRGGDHRRTSPPTCPYRPEAHLVFDHHASEIIRNGGEHANYVIDADAPSAARVVYDHFGGAARFPAIPTTDAWPSTRPTRPATTSRDPEPAGWALLNFLMDPRTGLGRFHDFRVSNYELMMQLIDYCLAHPVDQVLQLPDVAERVALYREQSATVPGPAERCTTVIGEVAVVDLRHEETIYAGNRFMVYALFPEATVSVHVTVGPPEAEHRPGRGQVDPQPVQPGRYRRPHARVRRRRPPQRRHLPGHPRGCRAQRSHEIVAALNPAEVKLQV